MDEKVNEKVNENMLENLGVFQRAELSWRPLGSYVSFGSLGPHE